MIRSVFVSALVLFLVTVAVPKRAAAQVPPSNSELQNYQDTHRYKYVVWQLLTGDPPSNPHGRIVGDFKTQEEASEAARKLNATEKHWGDWSYWTTERRDGQDRSTPDQSTIEQPKQQKAEALKKSKTDCAQLPAKQAELTQKKADLDSRKNQLLEQFRANKAEDAAIEQLRRSKQGANLVGTWRREGNVEISQYSRILIEGGGKATMFKRGFEGDERVNTTWTTQGDSVTLRQDDGYTATGVIQGNELRINLGQQDRIFVRDGGGNGDGNAADDPEVKSRAAKLQSDRSKWNEEMARWRADFAKYDADHQEFERADDECKRSLENLRSAASALHRSPPPRRSR